MDVRDLFISCRRGDLTRVQYLVEEKDVDVSVRDNWDSSPLYYACLCGHMDVVKYLLDRGAKCEAQTFDGERCVYGALNDEIKHLLKNYKVVTATIMRRDLHYEFMRRMLDVGGYEDITFIVHGHKFTAHKCVLAARCEYFAELLGGKWGEKSEISLKNHPLISPTAFKALLTFLYTARMEIHVDHIEEIILLAKHCRMSSLIEHLEDKLKNVQNFEHSKVGIRNITMLCLEPGIDSTVLQDDLAALAMLAVPPELCETRSELPFPEEIDTFPDVVFAVDGCHFTCHKVFFIGRSDYFKALIEDHFGEMSMHSQYDLPMITLHETNVDIFIQIMSYIYQDSCMLEEDHVYDILYAADMFLLPGLKRQCAGALARTLNPKNTVHILRTARLFDLTRLDDKCAEFIAENLEPVLSNTEFKAFVREDASLVRDREETDSIQIIDDVRFHIANSMQTFSDMYDADEKLAQIDSFLEDMGLDG